MISIGFHFKIIVFGRFLSSRRRRTFIRVYHHRLQSNDSGVSARGSPKLFGAISRPVQDMESRSKSPWTSTLDSIARTGGRGARPATLCRPKLDLLAARDIRFGAPAGSPIQRRLRARSNQFSRRRRTFIRVYHHRLQSNDSGVSARRSPGLFGAISRHSLHMESRSKSP